MCSVKPIDRSHPVVPGLPVPGARLVLMALALGSLTGCDRNDFHGLDGLVLLVVVLVAFAAAVEAALVAVLIVVLVKLSRGKPSAAWGFAAIGCGAFQGLPMLGSLFSSGVPRPASLFSFAVAAALVYVGWRNVDGAGRPGPPR